MIEPQADIPAFSSKQWKTGNADRPEIQALARLADDLPSGYRQELLHVIAVAAGLKPLAAIGFDGSGTAIHSIIERRLRESGLFTMTGSAWLSSDEYAGLPHWYVKTAKAEAARTALLYISRSPVSTQIRASLGESSAMAALLGYPICCVGSYHRRRRTMHRAIAEALLRPQGDAGKAARLLAAGYIPSPQTADRAAAISEGLGLTPDPPSGLVLCDGCRARPGSPGALFASTMQQLAVSLGWDRIG